VFTARYGLNISIYYSLIFIFKALIFRDAAMRIQNLTIISIKDLLLNMLTEFFILIVSKYVPKYREFVIQTVTKLLIVQLLIISHHNNNNEVK
jgi:hypothetical protein